MSTALSRLPSMSEVQRVVPARFRRPRHLAAIAARVGLAARTGFYLLLVYLIARLALAAREPHQPNANGALATVARGPLGVALLMVTAAGFVAFGAIRIWAGWRDDRSSLWTRARSVLEGLFYLALAWMPLSYALGNHSAGKEQQQHQTVADLLHLPGGTFIVFVLGVVVCGVAGYQVWSGVGRDYVDRMAVDDAPKWVRRLVLASGAVGIPARALVFLPVGVFFMVAAVQADPSRADGLDRELTSLTGSIWGDAVLGLCAAGLLVFVVYSALETRYREVTKDR